MGLFELAYHVLPLTDMTFLTDRHSNTLPHFTKRCGRDSRDTYH